MSSTTSPDQIKAAQAAADSADLDALLLGPGPELRYLSGYDARPGERLTALLVPRRGPVSLVVPRLEHAEAEVAGVAELGIDIVDHVDGQNAFALADELVAGALGRRAVTLATSQHLWAAQWHAMLAVNPSLRLRLAQEVLTPMRIVKTPAEIAELAAAAAAIDRVHARMGQWLRPGRTEAAVAADITAAILEEGHAQVSFVIVGSGPNGASPHHSVSQRVIEPGDVVVVDIGGTLDSGYGSDCTRTYCLGEPPADFVAYYEALRSAHQAAVDAVAPGVTASEVDAAARDVLTAAGYGENFIHRTGHGIGLDGHEDPYIVSGNGTVLRAGMTFSIEPGVYLAGRHGARIEDIVACTDVGVRRLNTLSTNLICL